VRSVQDEQVLGLSELSGAGPASSSPKTGLSCKMAAETLAMSDPVAHVSAADLPSGTDGPRRP
jgi:hypothetical protein